MSRRETREQRKSELDVDAARFGVDRRAPAPATWWNNIRRAWMTKGPDGEAVLADPQPPVPQSFITFGERSYPISPAVKVTA